MHDITVKRRAIRRAACWCAGVALAAPALVACHGKSAPPSGDSTTTASSAHSSTATGGSSAGGTVQVTNFTFKPQTLTVSMGARVTWRFEDSAAHTVDIGNGKIMSKPLKDNATYTHVFTQAGTYDYICSIHPYMHGSITVK